MIPNFFFFTTKTLFFLIQIAFSLFKFPFLIYDNLFNIFGIFLVKLTFKAIFYSLVFYFKFTYALSQFKDVQSYLLYFRMTPHNDSTLSLIL
jgi:hypothetical protein